MVSSDASRSDSAGVIVAHRSADAVQAVARFVVSAVLVVLTHSGDTGYERISLSSGRAYAVGAVSLHQALRPTTAVNRRSVNARVQTVAIDTRLVVNTIRVRLTLGCGHTFSVRLNFISVFFIFLKYFFYSSGATYVCNTELVGCLPSRLGSCR